MADEEKEPKAITYKQVLSAVGKEGSLAAWEKIGEISGAGKVPTGIDHDASIDLTNSSTSVHERIDKLLADSKADKEAAKSEAPDESATSDKSTKRGNK